MVVSTRPCEALLFNIGLTFEGDSGEEVALWRSTCNFDESPYVAAQVFSPLVVYENVDIVHVFIEIYCIRY